MWPIWSILQAEYKEGARRKDKIIAYIFGQGNKWYSSVKTNADTFGYVCPSEGHSREAEGWAAGRKEDTSVVDGEGREIEGCTEERKEETWVHVTDLLKTRHVNKKRLNKMKEILDE